MGIETKADRQESTTADIDKLERIFMDRESKDELIWQIKKKNIVVPNKYPETTKTKEETEKLTDTLKKDALTEINNIRPIIDNELKTIQDGVFWLAKPRDNFIADVDTTIKLIDNAKTPWEVVTAIENLFNPTDKLWIMEQIQAAKKKIIFPKRLMANLVEVEKLVIAAKKKFDEIKAKSLVWKTQ